MAELPYGPTLLSGLTSMLSAQVTCNLGWEFWMTALFVAGCLCLLGLSVGVGSVSAVVVFEALVR